MLFVQKELIFGVSKVMLSIQRNSNIAYPGKHKDKLSIFDSADGYIKQKQIDFENVWTNIIISFCKKKTFVSGNYCRKSIKKYINMLAPLRKYLLWIFLLSFVISAISISGNFIYQYVIDSIVSEKIKSTLKWIVFWVCCIHLCFILKIIF